MAATAADIRDALSLPAPALASSTPNPPTRKAGARKPDGVSRELFSLIGDAAPSLALAPAKPRFKARPGLGRSRVRWEMREFTHPGRQDGLVLKHWDKTTGKQAADSDKEYPFAKFSKPNTVFQYTDEEYILWLEDAEWPKEETDYLMQLVKEYDARFYVISDRYDFPNGVTRSLEDLKHRYFSICRKLLRNRPTTSQMSESSKQELIQAFAYDRDRELTRKAYIQGLLSRTPEQIAEEETLFLICKRLEQTERRFATDRDTLLRNLAGIESGLANLPVDDEPFTALGALATQGGISGGGSSSNKRKRKSEAESPVGTPPVAKKINLARQAVDDEKHCIIRTDGGPTTKAAHQPVFMRSSRIPQPKSTNATKVQAALTELGINFSRLVMPTRDTLVNLETLFEAAGQLVEAKRTLDKIEHEIRVLQAKKGEIEDADIVMADA